MPPLYRIFEVVIYSLFNLIPFLILALYPCKNHFRFSKPVTCGLITSLIVVQIFIGLSVAFLENSNTGLISAISTVFYCAFYFLTVKMHFGKTLFLLLMISNNANLIVVASKCLEGQIWPNLAVQSYRWSASVSIIIAEILILIPLFFFYKKVFTPAVQMEPTGFEWRYLWVIPAIFYAIWYNGIYGIKGRTSLEIALRPRNTLLFLGLNIGACFIYYVVAKLILEQKKNLELTARNHNLELQSLQYENLQYRINEARQAKHDVRHHVTLMEEYLKNNEYEKLNSYLNQYQKSLPEDNVASFCQNIAVNAVLSYFSQQAKLDEINFTAKVTIPNKIEVAETDLSVLFGNLLENALDASIFDKSDKKEIVVHGNTDNSSLCITVDNTFSGNTKKDKNGKYLSTKHNGLGLGIESVKNIVDSYNGIIKIEETDEKFCVSILIPLEN